MTRAELVKQAAEAWWEQAGSGQDWTALHENDPEAQWTRKAMGVVVDRILPRVSTVAELEALFQKVSENAEPSVVISGGRPFILTEDDYGTVWAHSYQMEDEPQPYRRADDLSLPLTVVWQP